MNAIEWLSHQPAAQAIGIALLHFVWQGAVIGAITAAALAALRRSAADVRYVVASIGLSLMLTIPVVSAVQAWRASEVKTAIPDVSVNEQARFDRQAGAPAAPTAATRQGEVERVQRSEASGVRQTSWLPILVLVWLCGVTVLSLRLVSGWMWVCRMRSHAAEPAAEALQELACRLLRMLHIRRPVRFLESAHVDVPTVIGWLKPAVLLPASALAALSPQQLEAILAHELAHIRRHDYLVNLLQAVVETLLFYHPAVWWLSRRIRIERENCCDDLAVSLCGDPVVYARALAELEELRSVGRLALAANGGSLLQRVRRLLGAPTHAGRAPGWLAGSAAILLIAALAAGSVGTAPLESGHETGAAAGASSAGEKPAPNQSTAPWIEAAKARQAALEAEAEAIRLRLRELEETKREQLEAAARDRLASFEARRAELAAVEQALVRQLAEIDRLQRERLETEQRRAVEEVSAALASGAEVARAEAVEAQAAIAEAARAEVAAAEAARAEAARAEAARAEAVVAAQENRPRSGGDQSGNFVRSNNGHKIEVNYRGAVEFTEDDRDIKSLSPGGRIRIGESREGTSRTVEIRADQSGQLRRRFWVGSSERAFEPDGREWLSTVLPRVVRQSGLGAPARVARILRARGVDGVLAEISLIEGSWGKRIYFSELLKAEPVGQQAFVQILGRASKDVESDHELASLLIDHADRLLTDDATRRAYFEATRSIASDYEMRRVLSSALTRGPISSDLLATLLAASTAIDSDYEAASLLVQVAALQRLDQQSRAAFFEALAGVDGNYERRRVLSALAARTDIDPATLQAMLDSGASIASDFELASFLLGVLQHHPPDNGSRVPFFRAVESIDSTYERRRVLTAVAARESLSADTVMSILQATKPMNGDHDTAQILTTLAGRHQVAGAARDLFIDIAEQLGDYEKGRVMSALVRSERR